jgi:C-terminal processing protease CtpA/Prc
MLTDIADGHATLRPTDTQPPVGAHALPWHLRDLDGQVVVWDTQGLDGIERGDVVEALDGRSPATLLAETRRHYPASNDAARVRAQLHRLTRGPAGEVRVRLRRDGRAHTVVAARVPVHEHPRRFGRTDRDGPPMAQLHPGVAYVRLSGADSLDPAAFLEADALVVDLRNYPSAFVVFDLGGHLVDTPTPFVRFTRIDPTNPGATRWSEPLTLPPRAPYYRGRLAILVDESTQSQAEYTAMAFRARPGAVVVGSTTAGADGNVSDLPLTGGLSTRLSGLGIFYPDDTPTQQVGIVPDVVARPTVAGIRDGRDEVLEAALAAITDLDDATIRRISARLAPP